MQKWKTVYWIWLLKNINIEKFISGKGLEDLYFEKKNERKSTKEIFSDVLNNKVFINNFYNLFNEILANEYEGQLKTGIFGAEMKIRSIDDGPFSLWLDSKSKNY